LRISCAARRWTRHACHSFQQNFTANDEEHVNRVLTRHKQAVKIREIAVLKLIGTSDATIAPMIL
jgi:hypothetical protein